MSAADFPVPPITCIIFCRFDVTLGPTLEYQTPAEPNMQDHFAALKKLVVMIFLARDQPGDFHARRYLIVKPELSDHLMAMHLGTAQIVAYPINIIGNQYDRNHLLFNIGFVFEPHVDPAAYEPVVRKLGQYFYTLEKESALMSVPAMRPTVYGILDKVLQGLNLEQKCLLPVDASNTIHLQVVLKPAPIEPVKPHNVPVLLRDGAALQLLDLDPTVLQLLPFVDGVRCAHQISRLSGMDPLIVCRALGCLRECEAAVIVEPFQFANVYVCTSAVGALLTDATLQAEALAFVSRASPLSSSAPAGPPLTADALFSLYAQLVPQNPWLTVAAFCERRFRELRLVDVRRLVQFGVVKGLLRRVHKYIVRDTSRAADSDLAVAVPADMLAGLHSADEICCHVGCSAKALDDLIEGDPVAFIFWK